MWLTLANIFGFLSLHKRIVLYCVGGLVLLGAVLYGASKISTKLSERKIDKLKANISTGTKEISNVQANLDRDSQDLAARIQAVKDATNSYADAVNASDAGRKELNQAVNNIASAAANNHPTNITAEDLQKRLDSLDQ